MKTKFSTLLFTTALITTLVLTACDSKDKSSASVAASAAASSQAKTETAVKADDAKNAETKNKEELKVSEEKEKVPALEERFPEVKKERYKVKIYKGKTAKKILQAKHEYKTQMAEALKKGVNFAGRYAIAEIKCGNDCKVMYIVNVINGKIIKPDGSYRLKSTITGREKIKYSPDSTLLYFETASSPGEGSFLYNFKGEKFRLIKRSDIINTGNVD